MTDRSAARANAGPAVGTFIYGSCVSRDSFEVFDRRRFSLTRYVARQSLISAYAPTTPGLLDVRGLSSAFQRRMLAGDVAGDLTQQLRRWARQSSLVLWDLTDERLGVVQLPDGSWVTASHELTASGALDRLEGPTAALRFGSAQHFSLWNAAARRFSRALREQGLHDRTLVLAVPWASVTSTGGPVPSSAGMTADTANRSYGRYYDYLEERCGLSVLRLPPELAVADESHRWGTGAYHYAHEVYDHVRDAVEQFVTSAAPV